MVVVRIAEIPEFPGYYAGKNGKIYSTLAKGCRDRYNLDKRVPLKELNYRMTKGGYCRVCMRREDSESREDLYVHRIIGQVFIANPENLPEINHKDCNKLNNKVDNLEWVTRKDNLQYAIDFGYMTRNNKGQFAHK